MAVDDSPNKLPKIAMKAFSIKKNGKPRPENAASAKTVLGKRPRSALASAQHSDSEDDGERHGTHEEVTAFESAAGGAVKAGREREKNGPLVIERVKNRDWKSEVRRRTQAAGRGKKLLPREEQSQRAKQITVGAEAAGEDEGEMKWGLTITKKVIESSSDDGMVLDTTQPSSTDVEFAKNGDASNEPRQEMEKTEDERALDALLGIGPKAPDLVIQRDDSTNGAMNMIPTNETDAYRLAVASAPDVSTLDEYERIPVAEFGAALLRGMGWKGESSSKAKIKEVKRRPNLLGLGAKELGDAEELGAWVQKADTKRLRPGGDKKGGRSGSGFVKPSDYKREKEREREARDSYRERDRDRDDGGGRDRRRERDDGGYRERSREMVSRRDDRERDYRRR